MKRAIARTFGTHTDLSDRPKPASADPSRPVLPSIVVSSIVPEASRSDPRGTWIWYFSGLETCALQTGFQNKRMKLRPAPLKSHSSGDLHVTALLEVPETFRRIEPVAGHAFCSPPRYKRSNQGRADCPPLGENCRSCMRRGLLDQASHVAAIPQLRPPAAL